MVMPLSFSASAYVTSLSLTSRGRAEFDALGARGCNAVAAFLIHDVALELGNGRKHGQQEVGILAFGVQLGLIQEADRHALLLQFPAPWSAGEPPSVQCGRPW
jgi:hypothetical protein